MHEGFVNYNAGTLGASMVEGRISAGVVVGDGSDIGGGASIMGTLSGGGKEIISIGERCLLGANAGHRHLARRRLRRRGGLLRHRRHQGDHPGHGLQAQGDQGGRALGRRQRAVPPQLGHRRHRGAPVGPARASASTRRCTATDRLEAPTSMRFRSLVLLVVARGGGRRRRGAVARLRAAARSRGLLGHSSDGAPGRAHDRAGGERDADRGDRGRAAGCPPGPCRSRWPRRTRRARSATSTTATATRWACSSSGPRRAGVRRSRCATPTTRSTRSTTRWRRSTTTSRCGSPRQRSRCSAPASRRPTRTTPSDARALASVLTGYSPGGLFTCVVHESSEQGSGDRVVRQLERAFGDLDIARTGSRQDVAVTVDSGTASGSSARLVGRTVRGRPRGPAAPRARFPTPTSSWRTGRDSEEGWHPAAGRAPPCHLDGLSAGRSPDRRHGA